MAAAADSASRARHLGTQAAGTCCLGHAPAPGPRVSAQEEEPGVLVGCHVIGRLFGRSRSERV